jgi:hypothetical protein
MWVDSSGSGYEQILGFCEHGCEPMGVYKMMGNSWAAEQLLVFELYYYRSLSFRLFYQNFHSFLSHAYYMTCPSHAHSFGHCNYIWLRVQVMQVFGILFLYPPWAQIFSSADLA